MSTLSKACLEISKSLKNFKFNKTPTAPENQKESTADQSKSTGSTQPSSTQSRSRSSATPNVPQPNNQDRQGDSGWNATGELSVTEALTRAFRQATNRVRSFSTSDRSGSQSFAAVGPTTSAPPTLPPPFFPIPSTNAEPCPSHSPPKQEGTDAAATAQRPSSDLRHQCSAESSTRFASLPTSPSGKTKKYKLGNRTSLNLEASDSLSTSQQDQPRQSDEQPTSSDDLWANEKFLINLFKYFNISHLCTLAQVCRLWRDVLYSDSKYWVDATPRVNCRELSHQGESVRRSFYSSLKRRKFDSLCLVGFVDDDNNDIVLLFPYCQTGVRKLGVRCSNVSDKGLKKLIDFASSAVSLELTGCNEITEAGLWACLTHRFTCLTLADCINVADDSVSAVAQLLPNLKEFNLQAYHVTDAALSTFSSKQCSNLKILRLLSSWEITNHGIVNVIRSLPNLTMLSLSGCSKITDDGVEVIAENLRQLRVLDLSWCSRITDASLEFIACDLELLQELTLDRCSHVSDIGVGYLSTMISLTHLFLRWCNQIRDFGLQRIAAMKNLKVLSLAGCNMLTSTGIIRLTQLSSLRELELTNCAAVAASDVCDFLHDKMPDCIIIE